MKALKTFFKVVAWALVAVLALVLALPLWIGPVVTGVANNVVPGVVLTDFHLGDFGLNPYTGCVRVGDMQLANPTNYPKENCVELGRLKVDLAMTSVFSKVLRIEEIDVDGLTIATTTGGGNFRQIAKNVSGEEGEAQGGSAAESPRGGSSSPGKSASSADGKQSAGRDEGVRVRIDRIRLRNLKLKVGMVTVPIPSVDIDGIGADSDEGATLEDAWNAVFTSVLKAADAIGEFGKNAIKAGAKAAGAAMDAVGNAADAAADAVGDAAGTAVDAVGNAAGSAADAVGGAVGNAAGTAMDAVGNAAGSAAGAAGKAADAVGGAAGKAVDAVGGAAGKAVDAVGGAAGKAVDAVKGIFK